MQKSLPIKPVVLVILDGFGIAPESKSNAIYLANMKHIDSFRKNYPSGRLIASSESVGLPANEVGNSEVGHLTLGGGRVIYQSLVRINKSIEEGSFYQNEAFLNAIRHASNSGKNLHIMGMVSTGTVHSSNEHLYALLELCKRNKFKDVYLHLFTDGRDSPPQDAINVIGEIQNILDSEKIGTIITIAGRYYAMDRDGRWERTRKMYEAMVLSKGVQSLSAMQAVKDGYARGESDEFIQPTVIPVKHHTKSSSLTISDGDSVIFFNFRIDRPRQLVMSLVLPNFESLKNVDFGYVPHELRGKSSKGPTFKRAKVLKDMYFVTMTEYQKSLPVSAVGFSPQEINDSLTEVISKQGLKQMHLAESEKERMVTFYFDGLKDKRFSGEDVEIVPSPSVATYDLKPEMSAKRIVGEFKKRIKKDYSFYVINFANPDMVGHTGKLNATIAGLKVVDKAVGSIVEAIMERDGTVLITADHGNAEQLLAYSSTAFFYTSDEGKISTEHTNNPVPIYIINNHFKGKLVDQVEGALQDVATTILALMGIPVPEVMSGRNLLVPIPKSKKQVGNVVSD